MLRFSKKWLPVLLVLGLSRDCQGRKPILSPAKPEIYIDEGESLELTCTSAKTMKFYYPKDKADAIETFAASLDQRSLSHGQEITFRRLTTVYGDTGWYGCADHDTHVTPGIYDQPEVSWTYVYIRSNTSYFVQSDVFQSFRGIEGGNVTLPCRPTSPHYKVTLNANNEEIPMGGKASYDPRFGFTLRNITLMDSDYFQCLIQEGDETQQINFHLVVIRNQVLNEPKIIEDTLRHVTRGQTLYVNCTTIVDADVRYVYEWITPQRSTRITTLQYKEAISTNKHKTTSELTVNGVTDEDEGVYECTIKTFSAKKKATTYIKLYDPDIKYINLSSPDNDRYYLRNYGDRIQLVVNVDAHPQPKLKWLNPGGHEIVGTWIEPERSKHAVNITVSSAVLRINRLTFDDMGLYSLQATNEDRIETLNFTLDVIAKPIPMFEVLKPFYLPKEIVEIPCTIAAFPAPNVSWTFLKAPNYPSLEGSETVDLKNYSIVPKISMFYSVVTMTIEMSGHLTCTACNTLGCDSTTDVILVSDRMAPLVPENNMNNTTVALDVSTVGHKTVVLGPT